MDNIEYMKIIENLTLLKDEIEYEKIKQIIDNIIKEITLLNNKIFGLCNNEEEFENKLKIHTKMIIEKELIKNSINIIDLYPQVLKDFVSIALNEIEEKVFQLFYIFFLSGINRNVEIEGDFCKKLNISKIEYLQHSLAISVKQTVYFRSAKLSGKLTRRLTYKNEME